MPEPKAGPPTLEQQLAQAKEQLATEARKAAHLEKQVTQKSNQIATLRAERSNADHLRSQAQEIATLRQGVAAVLKSVVSGQQPSTSDLQAIVQKLEAVSAPPAPPATTGIPAQNAGKPGEDDQADVDPAYTEMMEKAYAAGFSPEHPAVKKALFEDDGKTLRKPIDALTRLEASIENDKTDSARVSALQVEAARKKDGLPPTPPSGATANAMDWSTKPTSEKIKDGLREAFDKIGVGKSRED